MSASGVIKFCVEKLFELYKLMKAKPHVRFATLIATIGAGLLNPAWWVTALEALQFISPERADKLTTPSDIYTVLGAIFVLCAIALFIFGEIRSGHASKPQKPLIALRHQSFEGTVRRLEQKDLPAEYKGVNLIHHDIDQTAFYNGGLVEAPEAAFKTQEGLAAAIRTHMNAHAGAVVAYYGKAHIPFVFAAGYALHSETTTLLFELDRNTGGWNKVESGNGEDLGISVTAAGQSNASGSAVIRISISYPVSTGEVHEVVPEPHTDVHISLATPRIDAVTTRAQVDELARTFRSALDELRNSATPPACIHVFCAASMSVVFALGRILSPTIHPKVRIYNYSSGTTPRYAWGIEFNGSAPPRIIHTA